MPKASTNNGTLSVPKLQIQRTDSPPPKIKQYKAHKPFVSFIQKLYSMCYDESIPEISWTRNGNKIRIMDNENLIKNIFPVYFKHSCWPSFTRQLNMYGFTRVTDNSDIVDEDELEGLIFKHPLFVKGRKDLAYRIQRRIIHSKSSKSQLKVDEKQSYSNTTSDLPILTERIDSLTQEIQYLKSSIYNLKQTSHSQSIIIDHERSTMAYVKHVLSSLAYHQGNNSELKLAISALDNSLNQVKHYFNQTHYEDLNEDKISNNSDNIFHSNTLSPMHSFEYVNSHIEPRKISLPSIKFLLNQ